jgi:2'-5' RNA ligase
MRYVIAFLALIPNIFIHEAREKFFALSEGYLLGSKSLPHITLAQFYLASEDKLRDIWDEVVSKIDTTYHPKFLGLSLTKKAKNLWGVSLLAAREPTLVKQHLEVVDILKKNNISCISETGDLYRPHLTLARIKELNISSFNDDLLESSLFTLALGYCDENGQYVFSIFNTHNQYKEEL